MPITASLATNRSKQAALLALYRGTTPPGITTGFKLMFFRYATGTPTPDVDHGVVSEWQAANWEEIPSGNGYTAGGVDVERSAVGFDATMEDDTNDRGYVQMKDIVLSASGGAIPSAGDGTIVALLTDDNGTVANREVFDAFYLGAERTVSDGGSLTVQDAEIRAT